MAETSSATRETRTLIRQAFITSTISECAERIALTVERRGKTRQRVCRFPPIRLRFDKDDVEGTLLRRQQVDQDGDALQQRRRWEQYYVLEMLAYPIYNLITERSFRVRPLSVTYHDVERDKDDGPRFAFLIEDDKLVAERNGMDKYDLVEIRPERLDPLESSRFRAFPVPDR